MAEATSKMVYDVYRKNGGNLDYLGFLQGTGFNPEETGGSGTFTTESMKVGKWIDNSPIYRQVLPLNKTTCTLTEVNKKNFYLTTFNITGATVILSATMAGALKDGILFNIPVMIYVKNGTISFAVDTDLEFVDTNSFLVLEYAGPAA